MKKAITFLALCAFAVACNKTTTTPPATTTPAGCGDGFICFKLNGTEISKAGGGYELSDTNLFVKYEEGAKQLSIDIFGKTTGSYTVTNKRKQGNGRIYYFPTTSTSDTFYMAETGSLNISAYDAANKKITGTFSATVYKYKGDTEAFIKTDSFVITEGKFTNIAVPKI